MTVAIVFSAIALLGYIILMILTLRRNWRNHIHRVFAAYLGVMAVWQFVALMVSTSNNVSDALIWYRIMTSSLGGQFIFYLFFILAFLHIEPKRYVSFIGWALFLALVATTPTGLLIASVSKSEATSLYIPGFGPLVPLVGISTYCFLGYAIYVLINASRHTKSVQQSNRIRYLLVGACVTGIGTLSNLFSPLQAYPVDVLANILNAFLIAYTILRHNLLDLSGFIRTGLLYSIPTIIIGAGYFFLIALAVAIFHDVTGIEVFLASLLLAIIVAVLAQPLRDRAQSWIDRLFFREKFNSSLLLQHLSQTAASVLNLDMLANMILEELTRTIHVSQAAFFLGQTRDNVCVLMAQRGLDELGELKLNQDHPMIGWFALHDNVLSQSEIDVLPQFKSLWGKEYQELEKLGGELYVPVKAKDELVAILVLGSKRSNQIYSADEILTLTTLASQIAVAIVNARLYRDLEQTLAALQQAHDELETRVQQRTADLADANLALQTEVGERKRVEDALRESEERFILATRGANDGLWDWQLRTNAMYFSPRWKSMLGYAEDEISEDASEWFQRIHPEDLDQVRTAIAAHLKGSSSHLECEYRIQNKEENYIWVSTRGLAVRDENENAYRMAGSQSDITARKEIEARLLQNAFYDNLTGLPNRALFMDRLGRAIEHAQRRSDYLFSVLFMDIDRFKVINDSLGHIVGDRLLVAVAQTLNNCLRSGDTVARLGGDEFVILLEDIKHSDDAITICHRIYQSLSDPLDLTDYHVVTSTSIGVVYSSLGYDNPEDILRDADIAMYHAKMKGGATYSVFNTTLRNIAIARLELETNLRQALEKKEFTLYYQPILSLASERIIGFEALLRWKHPALGMVLPDKIISVAEETGLILPIGQWVMQEACRQLKIWQVEFPQEPPLMVNVNVSGKQFINADFVQKTGDTLAETQIAPHSLAMEITETLLLESDEAFYAKMDSLMQLGIHLHIDDFGTGYSSYSYLQRLPVTSVKIDGVFIRMLDVGSDNVEIVRSIVTLARSLGMSAIAEGVETEEQYTILKDIGCHFGQGYYFSKPLTSQDADALLISRYRVPTNPGSASGP